MLLLRSLLVGAVPRSIAAQDQPFHRRASQRWLTSPTSSRTSASVLPDDFSTWKEWSAPSSQSISELLRLARRMERIGEQQQRIARHAIGGEHGSGPPPHRAPADDEAAGAELLAGARDDGTQASLQAWHRVGPAGAFFPVEEVESDEAETPGAQHCRQANHAAVFPMTAGAVSADENRPPSPRRAGLENRGGFLLVDGDTPLHRLTYTGSPGCAPPPIGTRQGR